MNQRVIEGAVAEIGVDMHRFPSDRHLTSWTGICPGQQESAGQTHQRPDTEREPLAAHHLTEAALVAVCSWANVAPEEIDV